MRYMLVLVGCCCLFAVQSVVASSPMDKNVTARQIMRHCYYKHPGSDQRSRLKIVLTGSDGRKRESVYRRYWKNYQGGKRDGVLDKMVLFTEYPPDAQGAAFMRWAFSAQAAKNAEQWIYLPILKKIRRVSIRDLSESFLGSDLTYGDISVRGLDQDDHRLLQIVQGRGGQYFVIVSVPKERSIYSRKLHFFNRSKSWDQCLNLRTDYYDRRGELLKQQYLRWQKVGKAWVWRQVLVENVQSYHTSIFMVDEVEVDVGMQDSFFSDRTLRLQRK